mgnify:CR=1 FL=1
MKKIVMAILLSGIWINLSEFLRNEIFFKHHWLDKYAELDLTFPSAAVNNALWGAWGFVLAGCITYLARRLTLLETTILAWALAFLLMWVVIGNLNVLPIGLLPVAVPWSMAEIVLAVWIAKKITAPATGDAHFN